MGIQPSASATGLVLACPHPFEESTPIEKGEPIEPARYGSAFHLVIAEMLRQYKAKHTLRPAAFAKLVDTSVKLFDVRSAAEELAGHVKGSFKYLVNWIEREKLEVDEIETAYAVLPRDCDSATWRPIPSHDEDHHYECHSTEMPMTLDLRLRSKNRKRHVVLDHKTGNDVGYARPSKVLQMRSLGLAAETPLDNPVELGVGHFDRRGLPNIYVEEYEDADVREHGQALYNAIDMIGRGGFLRPGVQCERCPARHACPARSADLLSDATNALVKASLVIADEPIDTHALAPIPANANHSIEDRAGALYDLLTRYDDVSKAGREEIRRLVKAGAVVETRRGPLVIQPQEFETVSKKSILAAYGKRAGEKKLAELRKKGAVTLSKREMLVPQKEGRD